MLLQHILELTELEVQQINFTGQWHFHRKYVHLMREKWKRT